MTPNENVCDSEVMKILTNKQSPLEENFSFVGRGEIEKELASTRVVDRRDPSGVNLGTLEQSEFFFFFIMEPAEWPG